VGGVAISSSALISAERVSVTSRAAGIGVARVLDLVSG
jgi:hypothetical protein